MNDQPVPDPCDTDRFLDRGVPGCADEAFRRSLLAATTRVIRRRRRLRRAGWAAALAACYVAGLVTMRLATATAPPPQVVQQPTPSAPRPPQPAAASRPTDDGGEAVAMEDQAVDTRGKPREKRDLYCRAGDRYLHDRGDLPSAVRCYGGALDGASDDDLKISPDDSWLLMALKEAKQKERKHAASHR
jgi:hypothetical protein